MFVKAYYIPKLRLFATFYQLCNRTRLSFQVIVEIHEPLGNGITIVVLNYKIPCALGDSVSQRLVFEHIDNMIRSYSFFFMSSIPAEIQLHGSPDDAAPPRAAPRDARRREDPRRGIHWCAGGSVFDAHGQRPRGPRGYQ